MPDDYAGLYGFDKENAERLRAEMGEGQNFGPDYTGAALPPPNCAQSPLGSILEVLRASLLQHAELLGYLHERLKVGGVLTSVESDESMPTTSAIGFPLGEELASRVMQVVLMNNIVRGLLERLAV